MENTQCNKYITKHFCTEGSGNIVEEEIEKKM